MHGAVVLDEYRFARPDIAQPFELQQIKRNTFRGNHVFRARIRFPDPDDDWPNAVRIAKGDDAVADDHCNHRIAAGTPLVQRLDSIENLLRCRPAAGPCLQFVCKNVQQHLRIGTRVQMPVILTRQEVGQRPVVSEIAVVREAYAVGRIDVKRLRL